MIIKCWGSRGSIPVSGEKYIKYGGDTTCLEIRTKSNDIIIIDAGTGIRRLGICLTDEKIFSYHFLFTHIHWDHLMGFPFFKPLYDNRAVLYIYKCPFPDGYIKKTITRILSPPNFPVRYSDLSAKIVYRTGCPKSFKIGSVLIEPIALSHPNKGCGYKFSEDGKIFVFLTDNEIGFVHPGGLAFSDYVNFSKGADLLIHDAEYTPKEYKKTVRWGHSTYTDAVKLAIKANVKELGLFHINPERTDDQMDKIVKKSQKLLLENKADIKCFGVQSDAVYHL